MDARIPGMPRKVHFVSLGCAKNRVDTEVMLGVTDRRGLAITSDPLEAEVIVINTCGFIGPAKEESVNTILEMARFKAEGACEKLVVAGCLSCIAESSLLTSCLWHNLRDKNVTVIVQVILCCFWKLILQLTFFSCPSCTVACPFTVSQSSWLSSFTVSFP